jgi:Flp pilus assembly secretin CpaC
MRTVSPTRPHAASAPRRAPLRAGWALAVALVLLLGAPAWSDPPPTQDLLVSTHAHLSFGKEIQRVAVADPGIVSFEPLNEKEGLVLGRALGRTTVLVWFTDGTMKSYLFNVKRDLSLLEEALKELNPSITVQSAPDRDAVVLRGVVPDISYSNAAEDMAQRYLDARRGGGGRGKAVVQVAPAKQAPAGPQAAGGAAKAPEAGVEAPVAVAASAAVINLIRVQNLPGRLEERMRTAIRGLGLDGVDVNRLVRGGVPDDEKDIFLLKGHVPNQVDLVRVITLVQSMIGEQRDETIRVRADESGALADSLRSARSGSGSIGSSSSLSQLFGGSGTTSLQNLIQANLGRAKVIEAGNGRILSFVEVTDLPQVRVDIRLYEVNCTKLRAFNSDWGVLGSSFSQGSFNPARSATLLQGAQAARVGAQGGDVEVQNVLSFLSGTLANQFQLSTDHFAIDSLLSLLEQRGFARSLSRPSLTVLSGERAFFQVGGEVPVPTSFATDTGSNQATGVFNSVVFRSFGVQLSVRPLVGEDGEVTLDVAPQISLPDAQLTAGIRQSTGTNQATTAFRTRSLQTTAKLEDSQSLLVGGLVTRNLSSTDNGTPGLKDAPLIGGLFSGYQRQGDEFQLVVLVHPVVLRKPTAKARTWAFPALRELMNRVGEHR